MRPFLPPGAAEMLRKQLELGHRWVGPVVRMGVNELLTPPARRAVVAETTARRDLVLYKRAFEQGMVLSGAPYGSFAGCIVEW